VAGLDAATGKVYWREPMTPTRMPIGIATPIVHANHVFVTSFYDGSMMLKLDPATMKAEQVWRKIGRDERNTIGLHSIISTPIWLENHIYGVDSYGEFRCLEAATGNRIWEDTTATPRARWSTIHFVENGEHVWMLNERGELIIGKLSPSGYVEISRSKLLDPTLEQLRQRNGVCWSHPAFANGYVFARNDNELVCAKVTE
jgi:outer membrane protein assembly factor BamB